MKRRLYKAVASLLSVLMLGTSTAGSALAAENTAENPLENPLENTVVMAETDTVSTLSARATSMYLGAFTFTGTNTGKWRSVDGNYVRMCIAFKPIDGKSYSTELFVDLYQYSSKYIGSLKCTTYTTSPDSDGYYFFVSDYFKINSGSDCRMKYTATSSGTTYDPRKVSVHAWYDYY